MKKVRSLLTTIGASDPRPETYLAKLFHKPRYDEIVRIIRDFIGNKIGIFVDAGCGFGVLSEWLDIAGIVVDLYIGCEVSLPKLKKARNIHEKILCDINYLPFKEGSVDCIICSEVLEHLENPYHAFRELLKASRVWVLITYPDERVKNLLGFRYPEHISEPKLNRLFELAKRQRYKLILHRRLYYIFPPSILDKFLPYTLDMLKALNIIFSFLSTFRELCLIKTEILLFHKMTL